MATWLLVGVLFVYWLVLMYLLDCTKPYCEECERWRREQRP